MWGPAGWCGTTLFVIGEDNADLDNRCRKTEAMALILWICWQSVVDCRKV